MPHFYSATHPVTGKTALRNSASREYSHAVVSPRGQATFHGTRENAAKTAAGKYVGPDDMIVKAVELTAEEFAAAKRASKQKFTFLVEGKKVTRTRDVGTAPIVGLLVEVYEQHVTRVQIAADAPQATKDRHPLGYWENVTRAHVTTTDLFERSTYNSLAEAEAKVAGTYVKRDKYDGYCAIGERGLVRRYIVRPL